MLFLLVSWVPWIAESGSRKTCIGSIDGYIGIVLKSIADNDKEYILKSFAYAITFQRLVLHVTTPLGIPSVHKITDSKKPVRFWAYQMFHFYHSLATIYIISASTTWFQVWSVMCSYFHILHYQCMGYSFDQVWSMTSCYLLWYGCRL